ncbi:hypothetical protein V2J09_013194 [Rumex salicifolius]
MVSQLRSFDEYHCNDAGLGEICGPARTHTLATCLGCRRSSESRSKTLFADRGRFARVCVKLDLSKALKRAVIVNGSRILVEYDCGRFGQFQPNCSMEPKNIAATEEQEKERALRRKDDGPTSNGPNHFGRRMNEESLQKAHQRRMRAAVKSKARVAMEVNCQQSLSSRFAGLEVDGDLAKNDAASVVPRMEEEGQNL